MLAVTGRSADGWISPLNIYVPPQQVPSRGQIIDEAASAAGRDPRTIRRVYNVIGLIGDHRGAPGLVGDVRRWVDTLSEWAVDSVSTPSSLWPAHRPRPAGRPLRRRGVPAVRERVAALRSGR
ncbi:hypothetical protein E4K10_01570 [Streptomyces sp. T1317-0309]|nr:hypothetical protein E4K10_01570 [Streptomyces sp. T1317-0309]